MEVRADRFIKQLASEPLKPIYLIAGGEPLLVQECADALRSKARDEGYSEREVFDAEGNFDWDSLSRGMASLSLFASRRLFDLRLPTGKPGKDGSEALRAYCDNPPPDTVLMITAQDWSKAHAGKWSEAITQVGHLIAVWPLKPHELPQWIEVRLRQHKLGATADGVARLVERVEGNLLAAAQEIDKLALIAPGAVLDVETLERLVADSSRFDVFKLVEAALNGEPLRVPRILAALRAEGEQVPGLLPWTSAEILRVAGFAKVQADGGNVMAQMRAARVWESRMALYRRALDRHGLPAWEQFVAMLGQIDRTAKGRGSGDAWLMLERLLLAVADRRAASKLAA